MRTSTFYTLIFIFSLIYASRSIAVDANDHNDNDDNEPDHRHAGNTASISIGEGENEAHYEQSLSALRTVFSVSTDEVELETMATPTPIPRTLSPFFHGEDAVADQKWMRDIPGYADFPAQENHGEKENELKIWEVKGANEFKRWYIRGQRQKEAGKGSSASKISSKNVVLIFLYAPWCARSMRLKHFFLKMCSGLWFVDCAAMDVSTPENKLIIAKTKWERPRVALLFSDRLSNSWDSHIGWQTLGFETQVSRIMEASVVYDGSMTASAFARYVVRASKPLFRELKPNDVQPFDAQLKAIMAEDDEYGVKKSESVLVGCFPDDGTTSTSHEHAESTSHSMSASGRRGIEWEAFKSFAHTHRGQFVFALRNDREYHQNYASASASGVDTSVNTPWLEFYHYGKHVGSLRAPQFTDQDIVRFISNVRNSRVVRLGRDKRTMNRLFRDPIPVFLLFIDTDPSTAEWKEVRRKVATLGHVASHYSSGSLPISLEFAVKNANGGDGDGNSKITNTEKKDEAGDGEEGEKAILFAYCDFDEYLNFQSKLGFSVSSSSTVPTTTTTTTTSKINAVILDFPNERHWRIPGHYTSSLSSWSIQKALDQFFNDDWVPSLRSSPSSSSSSVWSYANVFPPSVVLASSDTLMDVVNGIEHGNGNQHKQGSLVVFCDHYSVFCLSFRPALIAALSQLESEKYVIRSEGEGEDIDSVPISDRINVVYFDTAANDIWPALNVTSLPHIAYIAPQPGNRSEKMPCGSSKSEKESLLTCFYQPIDQIVYEGNRTTDSLVEFVKDCI